MAASGRFTDVEQQQFGFELSYSTVEFLTLIDTYASHRDLDDTRRHAPHRRLAESIETRLGGTVTKPYEALLVLGSPNRRSSDEP